MKPIQKYFVVLMLFALQTQAQSVSYVETKTLQQKGIKTEVQANVLTEDNVVTIRTYLDGLGRDKQTVTLKGSPNKKDLVQPMEYDGYGRQTKKYLSYASTGADASYKSGYASEQAAFYNNTAGNNADKVANDLNPYALDVYEASPLDRIARSADPGLAWQTSTNNSTVKILRTNVANEVINWVYDHANGNATGTTYYPAGTLSVSEVLNQDGNKVLEFKDKEGRIILGKKQSGSSTYLSTYFVYDDFGNTRYVVPPAYVGTSIIASTIPTDVLLFTYNYDAKQRITEKKIPGASIYYYVYDSYDRVILMQDANQRSVNKWSYFKYDAFNRVILTGIYTHISALIQTAMQALVNGNNTPLNEVRQTSTLHGYSNQVWPIDPARCEVLTVNYYDDYDFDYNGSADYSYMAQALLGEEGASPYVKMLATGSKVKILGTANDWLKIVTFYDAQKRVIQVQKNNPLNLLNLSDIETKVYSFAGKPLLLKQYHSPGAGSVSIIQRKEYDHIGRVKKTWHKVGTNAEVLLSQCNYNEAGQVVEKNLHSENGGTSFLQSIDYTYNIKGQLLNLNNASLNNGLPFNNNDDANDLFGMNYLYEATHAGITNTPKYDGNISAVLWKSANTITAEHNKQRAYRFTYDPAGRLTVAHHRTYSGSSWSLDNRYTESVSYDANGNITTMKRSNSGGTHYDDLTMTYTGNRLRKVTDANTTAVGFIDGANTADEYTYDANGNMTADNNHTGLTIAYNHLNLPASVSIGMMQDAFTYSALGEKLKKAVTFNSSTTTTYYIKNIIYNVASTGTTHLIQHEEGRLKPEGTGYRYEYDIKDHAGNVRMTFDKNPTTSLARIVQEDHYYPFGVKIPDLSYDNSSGNKFLFNGKELQTELGMYDYGARFYEPALGRWHSVDPMAEKYKSSSPYNFVDGNPVIRIDPDGADWYKEENGTVKFDPKIQDKKDLKEGQTYLGDSYSEKLKSGGTAKYRTDGSIKYSKERDAYKRLASSISDNKKNPRENMAIILKNSVIVLPDHKNASDESKYSEYGYKIKDGKVYDPIDKKSQDIVATIHTHPLDLGPGSQSPSSDDIGTFKILTPNRPFFTMAWDGTIQGAVGTSKNYDFLSLPTGYSKTVDLVNGARFTDMIIGNFNVLPK